MRAENLSTLLLQLKNSPSIKDECQTPHDVWPGKQTRIHCRFMVTAGQETRGGMVENTERGDKGMLRGPCRKCHFVLSTLLEMWRWIFKMQPQLSFLKPSADIWDSGLLALRQHRKRGWRTGGRSLSAKGTGERDGSGRSLWTHHYSSTRLYCNFT